LPDSVAGQKVNGFNSCPLPFLKTKQEQVGTGHRRNVSLVQRGVLATPQGFAALTIHGVKGLLGTDNYYTEIRGLVEANCFIQLRRPHLSVGCQRRREEENGEQGDYESERKYFHDGSINDPQTHTKVR
jgi:hypothetical protein